MTHPCQHAREAAFNRQQGLCFCCQQPMWRSDPEVFARQLGITKRQARLFQRTAEHIVRQRDHGGHSPSNIVATCLACNHAREIGKKRSLTFEKYCAEMRNAIARGKYHSLKRWSRCSEYGPPRRQQNRLGPDR
ncbi:HNH endonuclease [Lysobacter capsici]|uniref:HNH endonuclease n=1 Tax=Lysobacter capsici TaxID=435897 RepID=UPI003CCDEB2A